MNLAVGFFDGVHLGHRAILSAADAALTFEPHPLAVLAPSRAPALILSCDERVAAIRASGVRDVTVIPFTRELAALRPEAFAERYLAADGRRAHVVCGANWRFGREGAGDARLLRALGFGVTVVPYAEWGGEAVSSTRVRSAIESGDLAAVGAMLARRYALVGETFRGKGLGRALGFPTVNVRVEDGGVRRARPPRGVYAVEVDGARGLANWGVAPTLGEKAWPASVLEIHFTGRVPPCAGRVRAEFIRFIRPERAFASLGELRDQIGRDLAGEGGATT